MLTVAIWAINAIVLGLAYWLIPVKSRVGRVVRGSLIFLTIFAVSFLLGHTLDIILESAFFVAFLVIERARPRVKYEFASDQTAINTLYFAAQGASWGLVYYLADTYLYKGHKATWGMEAQHWPFWLQGLTMALILDFKQYLIHLGEHRFNFLWRFHKVHHSTPEMNLISGFRTNLLENAILQAGSTYFLIWLFNANIDAVTLLYFGPNIILSGFFAHMNVDFPTRSKPLPWYAYIIVTPTFHAYHHRVDSPARGINLGEVFVFWDALFGSFVDPHKEPTPDVYGIPDAEFPQVGFFAQQAFSFGPQGQEAPTPEQLQA
jgi:sterol desaturase/sphingolipid hydroxylase (fatty acid hydroxylase superfamily)